MGGPKSLRTEIANTCTGCAFEIQSLSGVGLVWDVSGMHKLA